MTDTRHPTPDIRHFFPLRFKASFGTAVLVERAPPEDQAIWESSFADRITDHRYYELTQDTLGAQFEHRYLLLKGADETTRAVQPVFVVLQDLVTGMPPLFRQAVERVRKRFPGFLKLRMVMIGSSAGEGDLGRDVTSGEVGWTAQALGEVLPPLGRKLRATLIVFKDFPAAYRPVLDSLKRSGFTRVPSMPATGLTLDFESFEDYLAKRLSHAYRKNLRRKFRKAAQGAPLAFDVVSDVTPWVDQLVPLYRAVLERSELKFEELNAAYLSELGRRLPDRARFLLWREGDRIVAFACCLVHNGVLKDNYIGLDYSVALDRHLYFVTWRDTVIWALENGCRTYHSAPLNYDPKLHFRMHLEPLDLYARATRPWLNPLFAMILPWLEPTRYDRAVQQFPNKAELW